ncbi:MULTISPECIES: UrcA family protein [unclassified Novosphingobium]|nr:MULTISPECIES: UrcA family protein [unclassified Novosphingobium]
MFKASMAVLAASVITISPVYATAPVNPLVESSVILKLGNLDLATVDGQRQLSLRMNQAARKVCGERLSSIHLSLEAQSRECKAEVVADIRSRIEQQVADAGKVLPASYQIAVR